MLSFGCGVFDEVDSWLLLGIHTKDKAVASSKS